MKTWGSTIPEMTYSIATTGVHWIAIRLTADKIICIILLSRVQKLSLSI